MFDNNIKSTDSFNSTKPEWWKSTTIYQIYPRSFYDYNNDGVGDIKGIIEKLDYLKNLGVETIWISPFYQSPGKDHGYDISDYYSIDPLLGNTAEVDKLIAGVHERGMKIVFDMVLNHTSTEHPWFKESRSRIDSSKRDWYLWQKSPNKGKTPNNWMSMIGTKGWNYDETTDEWYYASFLPFQPDLNWANPEVQDAMFGMIRHWLSKGIDGFRLDIFNCIGKNLEFPDNPFYPRYIPSPDDNDHSFWQYKKHSFNHEFSFTIAQKLRAVVDEFGSDFPDRFLIGEVSGNDDVLNKFITNGLHLVFNFEFLHYKFSKKWFQSILLKMEQNFPSPRIASVVFSNHDSGRGIARINGNIDKAKLLALLQLTIRAVPVLYYGDEIGMGNHDLPTKNAEDPLCSYHSIIPKGLAKQLGIFLNRDDARTPMQWTAAGFSQKPDVQSWLPLINSDITVEKQEQNTDSLHHCYQKLLWLRRGNCALNRGDFSLLESNKDVLLYKRCFENQSVLIALNFSKKAKEIHIPEELNHLLFTIRKGAALKADTLQLPPYGGAIVQVGTDI